MLYATLRIFGWTLAVICYVIAAAVVLQLAIFFGLTPVGWALTPFAVLLFVGVRTRVRQRRAAILMGYLEQAMRLNLPLGPMIEAAAASETGAVKTRLTALADRLEMGEPLWRAVREAAPEVPYRAAMLLERAERLGRLPEAVARLRHEDRVRAGRERGRSSNSWSYPLAVACFTVAVVLFLGVILVPKFIEIFEDFQTDVPPMTRQLFAFSGWLVHGGSGGAGGALPGWMHIAMLLVLLAVAWVAWQAGFAREVVRPALWWLPLIGAVERDRGLGDVCFVLEESVAAGAPIDVALREAAMLDVNPVLRWRVEGWHERVVAGGALADSANASGLPRLLSGMLGVGQASGTLAEAIGFLRRFYDNRSSATLTFLSAAAGPAGVIAVALLVGWVVVAMFLPLVHLIEHTNSFVGWTP